MPSMSAIAVVFDASVALKWFHSVDESEVAEARALLARHLEGELAGMSLDLMPYEIGNALSRRGLLPAAVGTVLGRLRDSLPLIAPTGDELRLAAHLAARHRLSFYDASYAAVTRSVPDRVLVTADAALVRAGLGVTATEALAELGRIRGE